MATLDVGRVSPKDRLALKLGMARQEADAGTGTLEETVEKYYGSLRADLFAGPRLFFFGSTSACRGMRRPVLIPFGAVYEAPKIAFRDTLMESSGGSWVVLSYAPTGEQGAIVKLNRWTRVRQLTDRIKPFAYT